MTPPPLSLILAAALAAASGFHAAAQDTPPVPEPVSEPPSEQTAIPEIDPLTGLVPPDATPPVPGDEVSVVLTTGQRVEGVLVSADPGTTVVSIGGLDVRLRPSDIESIVRLPSLEERFAQMRGIVPPNDVRALLALAVWAESRGLLTRALGVVEEALDLEPQNGDALRAKATIERQIELRRLQRQQEKAVGDPSTPAGAPEESSDAGPAVRDLVIRDFPMLTEAQINIIKVMEVNLADPPRMVIHGETIETLLRSYGDHPAMPVTRGERDAFRRASQARILDMIFRVGARELYEQVHIIGHPESMRAFRDRLNAAWITNAMATTRCHGGTAGGRLLLQNRKPSSPESFYTNFLILERFRTREGDAIIDYTTPERSILLEMGLPREDAIYPHPEVPGWRPVFRSRDDRAYRRSVEWIRMMYQPRPIYPIEFTPPGTADEMPDAIEAPEPPVVR